MSKGTIVLDNDLQAKIVHLSDEQLASVGLMRIEEPGPPPEIEIEPEIACAAKWWADTLRQWTWQENGDPLQSAMASLLSTYQAPLLEKHIALFQAWLAWTLQQLYTTRQWPWGSDNGWNPKEPNHGSYHRYIHNDYHPDRVLVLAARRAGVYGKLDARFPIKTTMKINPGSVKVHRGYGASDQEIFETRVPAAESRERSG